MPYKIVQTIEGRKLKLMTCPSGWEKNNILKYPKKGLFRYINDENSKPEPDWDVMMCIVKRLNIATYDEGEKIITEMTNRSDTDDDAADHPQQVYKNQAALNLNIVADKIVKTRRPLNEPSSINLNNVAETMVGNVLYFENQDNMTNKTASILPQNIFVPYEPNDSAAVQDTYTIDIDNISESKKILDNQKQILENQKQLFDSNTAVLGQIETLLKVQNNILQKLSGLSVQLENAIMQITETDTDKKVQYLKDTKGPDNNPFYIKAIDSLQQLNAIEHQLTDNNYRNHLISTYSIVCSKGGKGLDCAYSLVDIMFTREFICQCSWSGGSRGDDLKVPLKGYKHVLSLFWEIIHLWDEKFTLKDNENFFKTILKNAQKRKSAKCERASTSRKRPKKTCTHENKIDDAEHTTTSKERNTKTDQNEIQTREDESQTAEAEKENRIYEQEINQTF